MSYSRTSSRRELLAALGALAAVPGLTHLAFAAAPEATDDVWPPAGAKIVEGNVRIDGPWSVHLPEKFERRLESGDHIFRARVSRCWQPSRPIRARFPAPAGSRRSSLPPRKAGSRRTAARAAAFFRWQYRLADRDDDGVTHSVNTVLVADDSALSCSVLFAEDHEGNLAREITRSLLWSKAG